jgi:ADP-L-glycero-D-manno-heptose 6-epimerase
MYVVTGGAGMIGSNIILQLNLRGIRDILVVDNLKNGRKIFNLSDLDISDYMSRECFIELVRRDEVPEGIRAVFHLGANSSTTEWDGAHLMDNNFQYSKDLLHWCQAHDAQFLYASSASVYGRGSAGFTEGRGQELPINMYAYSKFMFDEYVRNRLDADGGQVVGLRYFNVYGPREGHKGSMASTAYHFYKQALADGKIKLFEGIDGIGDGEQRRDFVYVEDCALVNLWFLDHPEVTGIFNVGSGNATTFNEVARNVVKQAGGGEITYIPFPDHLRGVYQNYTQADLVRLRNAGCDVRFRDIEEGIRDYLCWAKSSPLFV